MIKKSIKAFCEMFLIKIQKNILWNVLTGGRVCRAVDSLRTARCRPTKADKSKVDDPARLHTSYTVNRHSNSVPFSLSHFHLSIKAVNLNPWWWWLPAQFTTLSPSLSKPVNWISFPQKVPSFSLYWRDGSSSRFDSDKIVALRSSSRTSLSISQAWIALIQLIEKICQGRQVSGPRDRGHTHKVFASSQPQNPWQIYTLN